MGFKKFKNSNSWFAVRYLSLFRKIIENKKHILSTTFTSTYFKSNISIFWKPALGFLKYGHFSLYTVSAKSFGPLSYFGNYTPSIKNFPV